GLIPHLGDVCSADTPDLRHNAVTRHGHENEVVISEALSLSLLDNIWPMSILLLSNMAAITNARPCVK
ncbi:hypothetical protein HAX54_042234, partial [Datura stramonium]|nr:hypothetical protein [Datura stramonium]